MNYGSIRKTVGTATTRIRLALGDLGSIHGDTGTLLMLGPVITVGSSATAQAGGDNVASMNEVHSHCADPVDCATGNLFENQTDLSIGGRGLGLQASRTYNSQTAATSTAAGAFGYGWTGSYCDRLVVSTAYRTATIYHANGSTAVFSQDASGTYQAAPWVHSTLTANADGSYRYVLPSQIAMTFAADGRLLS
jgi:hypothetical protein